MRNKRIKNLFLFITILIILFNSNCNIASSTLSDSGEPQRMVLKFKEKAGFADATGGGGLGDVIANLIKTFLGVLAIIFIILIIVSGYNWMTAQGDETKVTKAKQTIQRAIIGLIIIVAAYSITWFVFKYLPFGTGSGGPVSG